MAGIDESLTFVPLSIAVLTISDTRAIADDKSGDTLVARLEGAGHRLGARAIVQDDVEDIRKIVRGWIEDKSIDAIITTGGTGFTGRDVTPEAIEPLFEKHMDGFSAVFHRISYDKIGTSTIQSRATAGVAGATYIFVLPGSPGACKDAWDGILAQQLDYRHRPCNFVEIMPRLDEHLRRGGSVNASGAKQSRPES
jgi:molybdenum cofactor biosynthesis protein B